MDQQHLLGILKSPRLSEQIATKVGTRLRPGPVGEAVAHVPTNFSYLITSIIRE